MEDRRNEGSEDRRNEGSEDRRIEGSEDGRIEGTKDRRIEGSEEPTIKSVDACLCPRAAMSLVKSLEERGEEMGKRRRWRRGRRKRR